MKPEINVIGNYAEGTQGGIEISKWKIGHGDESYTLDELKQIAISNNSYQLVEGAVIGEEARGIRWQENDPYNTMRIVK